MIYLGRNLSREKKYVERFDYFYMEAEYFVTIKKVRIWYCIY